MKYFLDTEFIEGFHKPKYGKRRHFIDLISIGIYSDDGREYQAISNGYSYSDASDWVRQNVLIPLYQNTVHGDNRNHFSVSNFHIAFGKSNDQIASEIIAFVNQKQPSSIEFYGYYSAYDWVLLCSLFGTMRQLPSGFPMYCNDLKQIEYEKGVTEAEEGYPDQTNEHNAIADAKWNYELYKFLTK